MIRLSAVQLLRGARVLLEDADLLIHAGQKVGLVGENGAGKSSLFALLRGELQADRGELEIAGNPVMAWVEQEVDASPRSVLEFTLDGDAEFRDLQHRIEQAQEDRLDGHDAAELHARFEAIGGYSREADAAQLLAGLGFQAARQQEPVASFSGGWRMRINLARALLKPSQILLLDEPTNHLDLEMRHALTVALQSYQGAMVLVSHDRHLLTTTTDEFWLVADGQLRPFDGDLGDYQAWVASRNKAAEPVQPAAARGEHTAQARREARRREAERREAARPLQQRVRQLDRELEELAARLAALERELADPAVYEPGRKTRLAELLQAQGELRKRQESLEEQWLEAQEQLEAFLAQS